MPNFDELTISYGTTKVVVLEALQNAKPWTNPGGPSLSGGQVVCQDALGKPRIFVTAAGSGGSLLIISSKKIGARLTAGDSHGGELLLYSHGGLETKPTFQINADHGTLVVRDDAGHDVLNFTAEVNMANKPAVLWIGTAKGDIKPVEFGNPGLIVLRNSAGEDGIVLDGSNGFSVRDRAGSEAVNFTAEARMPGAPAALWIGRAAENGGGPGLLVIRDKSGNDSITIDGAQGDIILANGDCAEEFEIDQSNSVEPGTVVVLNSSGKLMPATTPYDTRVVGVVSGAGNLRPGMVLDRQTGSKTRQPVALVGKVNCRVDADIRPIEVGDLLTSSRTRGHAMKAERTPEAFGAVIGKALSPLSSGLGLIPILVTLQ